MIPQDQLDALAKSVAEEVHRRTGKLVGHIAVKDKKGPRIVFTFKVDQIFAHGQASTDDLKKAMSWQGIYEGLVEHVLKQTAPWALAKKAEILKAGGEVEPEVPPIIDQQGRRHHRLMAETGFIGATTSPGAN